MTTLTADNLLDPMFDEMLTPASAERILSYRLSDEVLRRLEVLREKAGEDQLDAAERREYAKLVRDMDLVALFQAKARRILSAASVTAAGV